MRVLGDEVLGHGPRATGETQLLCARFRQAQPTGGHHLPGLEAVHMGFSVSLVCLLSPLYIRFIVRQLEYSRSATNFTVFY